MTKIHVVSTRDHLVSLTASTPLAAVAELIWNGYDALATRVQVILDMNELGGIDAIRIRDNGEGIDHATIKTLFGSLGESWKKSNDRRNGRAMHGKSGKGRFKAFALGESVEWITTYQAQGKSQTYKITGSASSLDDFEISEPVAVSGATAGTEVIISNLIKGYHSLGEASVPQELAKMFAAYLTEYPGVTLEYNGFVIDPKIVEIHHKDYLLGDVDLGNGRRTPVAVSIIEWKFETDRALHLCDAKGISICESPVGQQVRAPGFHFTAYAKSDRFRELDKDNQPLTDMTSDVAIIRKAALNKIKDHFRRRIAEQDSQVVERWKAEQIYPYEEKPDLGPVEEAERQVFDILAVNVQNYLPAFEGYDAKTKKFTFRLLAQGIRENPDSVQEIIGGVLGLKKEEQDALAELLRKTTLSSIISLAKTVANRLDFLVGLETLLFDRESKKHLLERDQLHKILENEAWLFDEEFGLAGSEERLEEVLKKHLVKLGQREDILTPVEVSEGKTGRVDLMLQKAVQPRAGEYDYMIVELKRPSKKVDAEVITQITQYAIAVARDERFHGVTTHWKFIAISNEFDAYAESQTHQRDRPIGLIFDDAAQNISVWAKTWAQVINDARARLHFVNQQLAYEADRESAKAYLQKTHAKFIPNPSEQETQLGDETPTTAETPAPPEPAPGTEN